MIEFTPEQQKAYDRYITARNRVGMGSKKSMGSWVPHRDYLLTVDVVGMNHPLFMVNDEWVEYKEAFAAWLKVEPRFRHDERMRMSRGDYGLQDSWEERISSANGTLISFTEDK